MKKGICLLIVLVSVLCITGCGKEERREEKLLGIDFSIEENETELEYGEELPVVALRVENYGAIVIELYPDIAPNTVNNFISLVKSGFYDNNTMHRLVPGFVLQGGDPTGTGMGGPEYSIKGEFSSNGVENDLLHEKGVVSMARSQDYDSAGSQFFIMLGDATHLDGEYAAFGKVLEGMDIVEEIEDNEKIADVQTGALEKNLTIKKALVDTKGKTYEEVEKIEE